MSVIGPMARCAADLSLALDVLADPDEHTLGIAYRLALRKPRHDELRDFRVLIIDTHPMMPTATSIRTAIDRLAETLTKTGTKVARRSPLWPDPADAARVYVRLLLSFLATFWPAEAYERIRGVAGKLDAADQSLAAERARGVVLSHRDWVLADLARARLRQRWRELFAEFDVVVCPIMPTPAFPHDHEPDQEVRRIVIDGERHPYPDQLVWAGVASAPGLPATSIPLGLSSDGLPVGAQIIGPMYEDRTPLRFAELVERELGGFIAPKLG
jgi:amidase